MCGIIGLIGPAQALERPLDDLLRDAGEAAARLTAAAGAGEAPGALSAELAELVAALGPVGTFGGCFALGQRPALVRELTRIVRAFDGLRAVTAREADAATAFELREGWNQVHSDVLDVMWRLENDAVGAFEALSALRPAPWGDSERAGLLPLYRVEYALRALDRLEIRGRDSAGVTVVVEFATPEQREAWLAGVTASPAGAELAERSDTVPLLDRAIAGAGVAGASGLAFVYKVAAEVGAMGDNVRALRASLRGDALLTDALGLPGAQASILGHTRWASNGVVNVANAHPQGDGADGVPARDVRFLAVLNGDIDNYPALRAAWEERSGRALPAGVTTDALAIPALVSERVAAGEDPAVAFRQALARFEGSFAIGLVDVLVPDRILLGIGGSGQSLYVGVARDGYIASSEVYGLVEATENYLRMDGERERVPGDASTRGQLFELRRDGVSAWSVDGTPLPEAVAATQSARITTRDIHIAGFPHFFVKEISQGVASVEKTIRGMLYTDADGTPRFRFGERAVPPAIVDDIAEGRIRRVLCVGQGTAAVASAGVATALRGPLAALDVSALPATEVSGHHVVDDMRDTLVVAVSQSGTTTDTNRTVDVLRARGARVLSIINRRDSDLVHKSDGVIYTSDGRDLEMSVASTKAFYAQIAAGAALALYLASRLGTPEEETRARAADLLALPRHMARVLGMDERIREIAERHLLQRRHWALAGSGPNRIAASEIRIKLSELCYKSIALDFLEDKKHIDLSSEPLIIVAAAGLDELNLADSIKEVAIFRAHRSLPIVITDADVERFAQYADEVIVVPRVAPDLSPILVAMAGHLLGYHAARAIEEQAVRLRALRGALVAESGAAERPAAPARRAVERAAKPFLVELLAGRVDAALDASVATRLLLQLERFVRPPEDPPDLPPELGGDGEGEPSDALLAALTHAISELSRPIDAIKHQAKTVTVGISRSAPALTGVIADALNDIGADIGALPRSVLARLRALTPLIAAVRGTTTYKVEELGPAGDTRPSGRIHRLFSTGVAAELPSRTERDHELDGTKWLAVQRRAVYVGRGRRDGRLVAIVPCFSREADGGNLLLMHVDAEEGAAVAERLAFLQTAPQHLLELRAAVTESGADWDDELLARVSVADVLEGDPDHMAAAILADQ